VGFFAYPLAPVSFLQAGVPASVSGRAFAFNQYQQAAGTLGTIRISAIFPKNGRLDWHFFPGPCKLQ
jgi:hypothetical protein